MDKHKADELIFTYIRKIFGFAMSRLSKIDEAEELAAEITFQVYSSLLKQDRIENPDGYVFRIAQNVYAKHIDGKKLTASVDGIEYLPDNDDFTLDILNSESYGILRREITYLSKIQREIIVQHYFHDKKVKEIAALLSLNENTVKWHLTCSRKELKTGMEKTRTTGTLGTEPIHFADMGHSGEAAGTRDTSYYLAKVITQNIAYAAYHQPRSVNEIAEELGINPIFVEDEVAVLEEYGFMDKLKSGKYLTNILIYEPNEKRTEIYKEIDPEFSKLFAEKFFAPILEKITAIPDWLNVPDNDINLMKWSLVSFMAQKLVISDSSELTKFYVKRPDGGNYIAYTDIDVKSGNTEPNKYWYCGDMWRCNFSDGIWWKSWQFDHNWAGRDKRWRDNLAEDYDKMYFWLKGQLPEAPANAESYARLLEKGYLLKKSDSYQCELIICDSEKKWLDFIPNASEEITELARQYTAEVEKAALIGQPKHMHELIKCMYKSAAWSLQTRVMEHLLDMGVLKQPTAEQAKGLSTIMFMGE